MNQSTAANSAIGVLGTIVAATTPEKAAIFAGLATGCWMITQIALGIYDRTRRK